MNRRILIQLSAPAVLIGAILFGTCLASVWSINRLQRNLAHILSKNVTSLEAAQELEIKLRKLRFQSFVYLMDPQPARAELIEESCRGFEAALERARAAINMPEEQVLIEAIQVGYQRYRAELAKASPEGYGSRADFVRWADAHPVIQVVTPGEALLQLNKNAMEQTAHESESVSERARFTMLLLGLLGPVSGLICGYGIARGWSRSIARLSVRLQDVHAHLDREVGALQLEAGTDLADLDRQMDRVVSRVREVAQQVQQHQQEILRAEQLAAVGQLAASVAHEVRNPLTSIKLLVGAALQSDNGRSLTSEDLRVMHGEVGRLEQTVQTLLDFARPPIVQRETCDLREIIRQALDLVRSRIAQQQVALKVSQSDQPVFASVDRGQFCTVFVNLFMNALDAMPQGGRIEVDVDASSHEIHMEVRDTGPGIQAVIADRLFTPFATTKTTGTGLGLSNCQRIMQGHGGLIAGRNRPEGGAVFKLSLPVKEGCHANFASR